MVPCWNHGNITRSKAEELLSRTGKDGSFLVRASESISRAYALCVLYRNCVYTYRILPNEEDKFTVQPVWAPETSAGCAHQGRDCPFNEDDLKYDLALSWKRHDFAASCVEFAPGACECQTVSAVCLRSCPRTVCSWEPQPVLQQLQDQGPP